MKGVLGQQADGALKVTPIDDAREEHCSASIGHLEQNPIAPFAEPAPRPLADKNLDVQMRRAGIACKTFEGIEDPCSSAIWQSVEVLHGPTRQPDLGHDLDTAIAAVCLEADRPAGAVIRLRLAKRADDLRGVRQSVALGFRRIDRQDQCRRPSPPSHHDRPAALIDRSHDLRGMVLQLAYADCHVAPIVATLILQRTCRSPAAVFLDSGATALKGWAGSR